MNKDICELIEYPKKGILSKKIIENKESETTLFCMAEGTKISEHTSTKPGIIYIVEGKGIFNLGGKDIKMQKNVFIFMEKNIVHSLTANENTSFLLILFKIDKNQYRN